MGAKPQLWKGSDVLVWLKLMAYDLCDNWDEELLRQAIVGRCGPERMRVLMPAYLEAGSRIITEAAFEGANESLLALDDGVRALFGVAGFGGVIVALHRLLSKLAGGVLPANPR